MNIVNVIAAFALGFMVGLIIGSALRSKDARNGWKPPEK